jgi:hypothetical protein
MTRIACAIAFVAFGVVVGCTPPENAPLYFGKVTTLGVSAGAGASGTTGDLTIGFKDANLAIVPTLGAGGAGVIQAVNTDGSTSNNDALSTYGSFESQNSANGVSLGQFFSTGLPGQSLARGVACAAALKAAGGQGVTCSLP